MNPMNQDPDRFLLAAFLPDAERHRLEDEAGDDRRARAMIRSSDALRAAMGEAEAFRDEPGSAEALAFLAATRAARASGGTEWDLTLGRLEQRLLEQPEARDLYRRFSARIQSLESASDAEAHYRRLTGGGPRRAVPLRSLLAAAVVVVALAAVAVTGRLVEDPLALAAHESVGRSIDAGPAFRGLEGTHGDLLRRLYATRELRMGVWPVYDADELMAISLDMGVPRTAEEWLLEGRLKLMTGDRRAALWALRNAESKGAGDEAELLLGLLAPDR